ncbi:hypothetical protein TNCV_315881 [Trichonephila clavipes]|nr:hypothetical protein TNCV_315881 [Trichonephila clavipes]
MPENDESLRTPLKLLKYHRRQLDQIHETINTSKSNNRGENSHGHLPKLTPNNRGYVQGKPTIGDTWGKSGKNLATRFEGTEHYAFL